MGTTKNIQLSSGVACQGPCRTEDFRLQGIVWVLTMVPGTPQHRSSVCQHMPSTARLPQPQLLPLPRTVHGPHRLQGCPIPIGFGNCATPWGNSVCQKGGPFASSVGQYSYSLFMSPAELFTYTAGNATIYFCTVRKGVSFWQLRCAPFSSKHSPPRFLHCRRAHPSVPSPPASLHLRCLCGVGDVSCSACAPGSISQAVCTGVGQLSLSSLSSESVQVAQTI